MRKRTSRGERESSLGRGWIVSGDEDPAEVVSGGDVDASGEGVDAPDGGAAAGENGAAAGAAGAGEAEAVSGSEAPESAELSNAALVVLGVLGGLYLLYAWIWLSWAQFYSEMNAALVAGSGSLGSVLQQILFWAAPAAPILWFLSVMLLCRGARTRRIAMWLVVGAIVLLPYPIFSGGGAA
ncbi:hypothetical protein [Leucobacter sp. GX24907]